MRKRNAAPLLWRLIQQMSITWTKPAQQSFCEKRPQIIHCPHNHFSTFARETIFHKCVIWCPQLATISCERWRLCFPKAGVCPSRKHTHMSNPHLDLSEVFNIHPAVRKAYWQNAPIKLAIKEETREYTRKRNMRTDTFLMHAMRKCILHIQAAVYLKIKSLIRVNISVWIIFDRHTRWNWRHLNQTISRLVFLFSIFSWMIGLLLYLLLMDKKSWHRCKQRLNLNRRNKCQFLNELMITESVSHGVNANNTNESVSYQCTFYQPVGWRNAFVSTKRKWIMSFWDAHKLWTFKSRSFHFSTSIWVRQLFAVGTRGQLCEMLIELLKLQMNVIDTDLLCLGKSALVPLRPPHDKLKINATFAWISTLYEAHIGERCSNISPYFQLYHFYVRLTCSPWCNKISRLKAGREKRDFLTTIFDHVISITSLV